MLKPQLSLIALLACVACGSQFDAGGSEGAAGNGAAAGEPTAGDTSSGGANAGGANAGGASAGGASASGGRAAGGAAGSDCAGLKVEYAALVKKARVCDKASSDECSASSSAPAVDGCGCPTLLNVKSEYTPLALDKYKQLQKGNCNNGPICDIACLPPTSASCASSTSSSMPEYVCTPLNGPIAN